MPELKVFHFLIQPTLVQTTKEHFIQLLDKTFRLNNCFLYWGGAVLLPEAMINFRVPEGGDILLSDADFDVHYRQPWRNLSFPQAQLITRKLAAGLSLQHGYVLTAQQLTDHRALQWMIVDACNTGLFDPFPTSLDQPPLRFGNDSLVYRSTLQRELIAPEYSFPYQQCYYCGRTGTDPRGISFGTRLLHYCHYNTCSSSGNPRDHDSQCCYGQWKRIHDSLRKTLKRNETNVAHCEQTFHTFLKKRYAINHGKTALVQVASPKPPHLMNLLDPYRVRVSSPET